VTKQILGMRSTATSAMGGFNSNRGKVVRERKIGAGALEDLINYVFTRPSYKQKVSH
jgi:hypothetical protein